MRAIRTGRPNPPAPATALAWLAALATTALTAACDNPACVFGPGNCQGGAGGPGGALAAEAFAPPEGIWIADGAPAVNDVFPSGAAASTTTPVAVFFSESLVPSTTGGAFRIERDDDFGAFPVPATSTLVGDGRVLVLLPQLALEESTTYRVFYSQTADARDYTGQSLSTTPGSELGVFTTAATDPALPSVVATYPRDGATFQSATGEIAVLFDRPMAPAGFAGNGFQVTVGGTPPAADPAPVPLALAGGLGPTDTRVWRWRSIDGTGEPLPLGNGVQVAVSLSPAGAKLAATTGGDLPATIVDFTTAAFAAPLSAELVSTPSDAIGVANLVPGGGDDVALEVTLEGAQANDRVDVFLFGENFEDEPHLVALQRSVTVSGGDPTTVTLDLEDLELTTSISPLAARLADGELLVALRLQRSGSPSPITLLDVDPDEDGAQGPVLDTVPPELEDLLAPGGGGDLFESDLAGLTLAGTASEPLRRVEVATDLGDNGPDPDVVGAHDSGFFVARPVPIAIVDAADQPLAYEIVLFDRALNASASIPGLFRQLGAASGGALAPEGELVVEVFDALSLERVEGALVVTHEDLGDASAYPELGSDSTDVAGLAIVPTHTAGGVATIVSIDAAGYDRVTFHGVASARLSVPLTRTPPPVATLAGTVTSTGVFAALTLPTSDLAVDDTRRGELAPPTFPVGTCTGGPFGQGLACPFGPVAILPLRAGARAFVAGDFGLLEGNFSAASLIKAFALQPASPPASAAGAALDEIAVDQLLIEPGVAVEDLPVALPPAVAEAVLAGPGLDLASLVDDPQFGEAPRVSVDLLLPGQHAPLTVGLGIAYATVSPTTWTARAAYPGAAFTFAETLGDPSLSLRLASEWRDTHGASSRVSLGLSEVAGFGNVLFAPPVPAAIGPAPDEVLAAATFDVVLPNTLLDGVFAGSPDGAGLYRVQLVDSAGRGWTLWRPDLADASAEVRLHVPDLAAAGGTALPAGALVLSSGALAYGGFDPAAFLFSDFELRAQFRAESAPRTVQVP